MQGNRILDMHKNISKHEFSTLEVGYSAQIFNKITTIELFNIYLVQMFP